jgi:hypothetical protein
MKLFKKTVENVSPAASKMANKYCRDYATDGEVEDLLKIYYKTCRNTLGLRIELEEALKKKLPMNVRRHIVTEIYHDGTHTHSLSLSLIFAPLVTLHSLYAYKYVVTYRYSKGVQRHMLESSSTHRIPAG